MHDELGVDLPLSTFVQAPTIRLMAAVIDGDADDLPLTVPLRAGTASRPLFLVHGLVGDIFEVRGLVERLHTDRPVYGVRARGLDARTEPHTTVRDMAREYIRQVRAIQPNGPYALGGYSFGGIVAFEMARLLANAGERVDRLVLIDTYVHPGCLTAPGRAGFECSRATALVAEGLREPRAKLPPFVRRTALRAAPWLPIAPPPNDRVELPPIFEEMERINLGAYERFRPQPYEGSALFVEAFEHDPHHCRAFPIWRRAISDVTRHRVPGGHFDMLNEPHVDAVASVLDEYLA
jgi:acetoacetyl-CoA synthetase